MIWVFVAAGGAGFLLGLRYKLPALVAVSGLAFLVCFPFALFAEMGLLSAFLISFGLLGMLQVGYLGGTLAAGTWAGTRTSSADVIKDDDPTAVLETTPTAPLCGARLPPGRLAAGFRLLQATGTSLGSVGDVSLAKARRKAAEARR
jgi:hypothetical protein